MAFEGITMRQSDYGLDLLGTIVDTQLKAVNFLTFILQNYSIGIWS